MVLGLMHGHRADRRADPLNHFRHATRRERERDGEVGMENQQETNKKPKQKPQELVAQMR